MDRRTAAGWGFIVVGGLIDVVNYYPTTRAVVDGLKASGGTGAVVADVLLNPLFGLVVIVVGLLLLRSKKGGGMSDNPPTSNNATASQQSSAAAGPGSSANTNINTANPTVNVTQTNTQTVNVAQPKEQVFRMKYSQTQKVVISSEPIGVNVEIDLDGTGKLLAGVGGRWSLSEIELYQPEHVHLHVDNPDPNKTYPVGAGGMYAVFPAAGKDGIEIKDAIIAGPGKHYLFNRNTQSAHIVESDGRTFKVTLRSVRDRSGISFHTQKHAIAFEYEFSVTEQ